MGYMLDFCRKVKSTCKVKSSSIQVAGHKAPPVEKGQTRRVRGIDNRPRKLVILTKEVEIIQNI